MSLVDVLESVELLRLVVLNNSGLRCEKRQTGVSAKTYRYLSKSASTYAAKEVGAEEIGFGVEINGPMSRIVGNDGSDSLT